VVPEGEPPGEFSKNALRRVWRDSGVAASSESPPRKVGLSRRQARSPQVKSCEHSGFQNPEHSRCLTCSVRLKKRALLSERGFRGAHLAVATRRKGGRKTYTSNAAQVAGLGRIYFWSSGVGRQPLVVSRRSSTIGCHQAAAGCGLCGRRPSGAKCAKVRKGSELTGTRPTQLSPSAPAVDIRLLFSYTEVGVKLQIGGQEN
jgi:hypothetical protein